MNGLDSLDIEKFGKSYGTVFWDSQKKMMKKQKSNDGGNLTWSELYELQVDFVRDAITNLGWTIRDFMNTDCLDIDEILLKAPKNKKTKKKNKRCDH